MIILVNKSCFRRVLLCGCVWLLRCRCFLPTPPHPRGCVAAVFHHASYVLLCVCVQLRAKGIFCRINNILLLRFNVQKFWFLH
jgi:hypothetical protein